MEKRTIGGLALAVGVMIVFVLLRVSLPLKTILAVAAAQFLGLLIAYPWVWKPRGFTFGRSAIFALVVSGTSAAVLLISSELAGR
ncbi:MAG: hypothetical protein H7Z16_00830 [Pyrinomonadaceae bacterium]|nr:hypothetical protein [Pyrinomonadaceae bacterium]